MPISHRAARSGDVRQPEPHAQAALAAGRRGKILRRHLHIHMTAPAHVLRPPALDFRAARPGAAVEHGGLARVEVPPAPHAACAEHLLRHAPEERVVDQAGERGVPLQGICVEAEGAVAAAVARDGFNQAVEHLLGGVQLLGLLGKSRSRRCASVVSYAYS